MAWITVSINTRTGVEDAYVNTSRILFVTTLKETGFASVIYFTDESMISCVQTKEQVIALIAAAETTGSGHLVEVRRQ